MVDPLVIALFECRAKTVLLSAINESYHRILLGLAHSKCLETVQLAALINPGQPQRDYVGRECAGLVRQLLHNNQ